MTLLRSSSELDQTGHRSPARGLGRLLSHCRTRTMLLQSLVAGILSYELYRDDTIFGDAVSRMVALGLMLFSGGTMLLPKAVLERVWFPGALISINTLSWSRARFISSPARQAQNCISPIFFCS
ncbi:MAG: hypothetical protein MRJ92_01010 [Nitrospira sp.]|nr:hypothetical protein [Nitrospira sp.]